MRSGATVAAFIAGNALFHAERHDRRIRGENADMNKLAVAFAAGLVFGAGLLLSQMSNPAKVIGFLDVSGAWDPSLAFVMAGAVSVFALAYRLALRRDKPLLETKFGTPSQGLDRRLVIGALIFGVGWGLGGFCPGPAIVSAAFAEPRVWAFIASMVAGIVLYRRIALKRRTR
jgi:uncharacterized membrane protein YedE/YeeE